jgi:hypothetical protein
MNYCPSCGEKRDEGSIAVCAHCGATLVEWEYILLSYVALGIQVIYPNGEAEFVRKGLTKLHSDYCQVLNELGAQGWEAVLSQHHVVDSVILKRPKPAKTASSRTTPEISK